MSDHELTEQKHNCKNADTESLLVRYIEVETVIQLVWHYIIIGEYLLMLNADFLYSIARVFSLITGSRVIYQV
jgi:hypothetical protein